MKVAYFFLRQCVCPEPRSFSAIAYSLFTYCTLQFITVVEMVHSHTSLLRLVAVLFNKDHILKVKVKRYIRL